MEKSADLIRVFEANFTEKQSENFARNRSVLS